MVFAEDYACVYDILYRDKNYEKECDFIEALFEKWNYQPKTILDLGCGTGEHAVILTKRGYKVTGVDRSSPMLEIARKKARDKGLEIEFIEGDLTNISLNRKFDAVISMFAVISYQTTNEAVSSVCKLARESLVPGGLFMFDCWHGLAVLKARPSPRIKEVKLNSKEKIIRFTEPTLSTLTHTAEIKFKTWMIREDYLINKIEESHVMRFLFPQEIKYFLEVAGFKEIEFCPFLEFGKLLTEDDWNMTVIAKT